MEILNLTQGDFAVGILLIIIAAIIIWSIWSWFGDGNFKESWAGGWRKYPNYVIVRYRLLEVS